MPPRLLLAAVLALLAACVPGLLAAPAFAAAPTELTAATAPSVVVYPGAATVTGAISSENVPLAGAALSLFERRTGDVAAEWTPAGSTTARANGTYRFSVAPSVSTDYQVRFADDGTYAAAETDAGLLVRPRVTTNFPASLWLGARVFLRGAVAPAHPGASVAIERRVAGVWQPFLTVALNQDSRFALSWTPVTFGYYRLRARVEADADHGSGVSAAELVIVNRPNAHRVPLRYAHYIVIVRHEYRLYYYERGVLVRGFDVALGRPGYRTPLGYFHIYGKRKPAGGALGACAMFYRRQGGIAIHGTNQPYLLRRPVPRDFSHGCARMFNRQVLWLYARVPVGTHVHNLR